MKRENNYKESKFYKENYQFIGYYDESHRWHNSSAGWRYGTKRMLRENRSTMRFFERLIVKLNHEKRLQNKSAVRLAVSNLTGDDDYDERWLMKIHDLEKASPADWNMVD